MRNTNNSHYESDVNASGGDSFRRTSKIINDKTIRRRDQVGGSHTIFTLIQQKRAHGSARLFGGSILFVVVWSVLCALAAYYLREEAGWHRSCSRKAPDSPETAGRSSSSSWSGPCLDFEGPMNPQSVVAQQWLEDIKNCRYGISTIGSLFVFTLVFRFKACYDRWWESRVLWGGIISTSLELGILNRSWIADEELASKMNRFTILLCYTTKSLLRGKSIGEDGEDGPALVKRNLLTQEELDDMHDNPSWQPYYCLHTLRVLLVKAHLIPEGKGLKVDGTSKIHSQIFRCWDNTYKELTKYIGHCIRLRTSGLPATYDAIVMVSYFTFFTLASVVWSVAIGWATPVIIFAASSVMMFLIAMGTDMVDPFGLDKVDIPMEAFCRTIEQQLHAIDERNSMGTMDMLASKKDT